MFFRNKIRPLTTCSFYLFLLSFTFSYAQSNDTYFHELEIQGVPFNKKVNTQFVDSYGYLWIGCDTGLYRYDGNNLISFQLDVFDEHSIPNNGINSIIEDDNTNLWIGSESYLIHYNRSENKFKGFYKNITVTVLNKSSNGDIWANLRNTGLVKIRTTKEYDKTYFDTKFNYTNDANLISFERQINSFEEDHFGRYWLGTPKGIFILNDKNEYIQSNFKKSIKSLKLFENNKIIALTDKGLFVLGYNKTDYKVEILEHYENFMNPTAPNATSTYLTLNPTNNDIWIGTTGGLFKAVRNDNSYEFTNFSQSPSKGSLKSNHITNTTFDTNGNLWIGTLKGINKYLGRTSIFNFNKIETINKIDNAIGRSLLFYNPNTILVAMNDGLYKYNPKLNTYFKIETGINNLNLIYRNFEKDKLLLVNNSALYITDSYTPQKRNLKLTEIKKFKNIINDIAVINNNEIWVGLWNGGVDIINSENQLSKFKQAVKTKLANNHTSTLLYTITNELWIGTRGEGLFKVDFNNESIEEYLPSIENGLTSNAILSLFEDSSGTIWIGTRGGGLNQYIKGANKFKHFTKSNGLVSNTISSIEEDRNKNIWLSTQDGLIRYNLKKEKFRHFGIEEGIQESQFIYKSSATNNMRDQIYFGCSNGFYSVLTNEISQNTKTPSTVITNFKTLGATKADQTNSELNTSSDIKIGSKNPIELPYNQNNIVVSFSSLDLTAPIKNEYAYKLEGLNNYWIYTNGSNRNANYNDLPPGSYTFKVKSSNSDGFWNETPTALKFTIEPPIWRSNLAYFAYFLFSAILLFIGAVLVRRWYNLKKNLVKETISREKDNEHNRMKMVFFTDISHELRTPLSLIFGTIEKVIKEKNFTLSPVTSQRIYNNTLRMRRLINQIMDIRKFDAGKFELRISKNDIVKDIEIIKKAFNDFAKMYQIKYGFTSSEKEIKGWYDVDILEKILFNLLSNAFKYTPKQGEINVNLEKVDITAESATTLRLDKGTYIKCTVQDNGVGIPESDLPFIFNRYYQATKSTSNNIPGTGIGMELVEKLIDRHHGIITVESKENTYTKFTFLLPIDKNKYTKGERLQMAEPLKKNFIKNSEFQVIEEVAMANDAKTQPQTNKPKVLLVEDNLDLRQMLKEELKDDFNITEASNGKEGYEAVLKEKPQLIISDILMPVEDGISMLKQIKANPEINSIPIFMLTAKNSEETKIECLSLGADDYIEKPFSLEFVKWKVKNTFIARGQLKKQFGKVITAEPSEIEVDSNSERFIRKLVAIIEESMNDNLLSVEYLASEVGMSRANLYRKLQTILNDTPVNFIKKIRLKRAEQLLRTNDLYLSEIAYMTGFNNQKYFGKCFQKEYGMSPTEYIKKYKDQD
ncbi:hybrid sensor histidine kinase/response regulator transcription factor [Mariniflexile sp. AS56]|uniref:hybrid sensor histidine kinase/response regulator transcription factor n=1 Tax=Mariniflexile sp. AS56 TaxID=3063957 RepID=UPI0026E97970|nr:hybrid sensor histidine kinase/response regulator transcription factor [Mariniflexile sp. AS56]MDO7172383.1 response regulator [Mariniflexile sp. AS56]